MSFNLSPSVEVTETDLTTRLEVSAPAIAGWVGEFAWGPVNKIVRVANEDDLVKRFHKPIRNKNRDFLVAAQYLSYSNNLLLSRVVGDGSLNATALSAGVIGSGFYVPNQDAYESGTLPDDCFIAKYPGLVGNSLRVYTVYNQATYDLLVASQTGATTAKERGIAASILRSIGRKAPTTNPFASDRDCVGDEFHLFVVDFNGAFRTAGTILESYVGYSSAKNSKNGDSAPNFIVDAVNRSSKYVYFGAYSPDFGTNFAEAIETTPIDFNAGKAQPTTLTGVYFPFSGGALVDATDGDVIEQYGSYQNKETVDVGFLLTGGRSSTVINEVATIAKFRKDVVVFIAPRIADVVNNFGNEVESLLSFRDPSLVGQTSDGTDIAGVDTSYAMICDNWKYVYDQYNDIFTWVPCDADLAGLCAKTERDFAAWYPPAGFTRGYINNAIKMAWSSSELQRDQLYPYGINSIASIRGRGVLLFGDKTAQSRPSAFDRIGVRRLFIYLETTIARYAQFKLFEFNDEFTRGDFVSNVTPFLESVKNGRGIIDYKVVCDESNNTPDVIDSNQFIGDIYIKPNRSINYIKLNFVAVATGVAFDTVIR